jgi:glycosyltransferase involved in cell wall biosynthesis
MPALRRAAKESALALAVNAETYALLKSAGASRVELFQDCGTESAWLPPEAPERPIHDRLILHWSGRLEYIKALPLALEAVAKARDLPVYLVVSGDGPLRSELQNLAKQLGIPDRVTFSGFVPRASLMHLFREADAFIFTSLRDTFGSVVLEAMGQGLPILTLNHQGVGTHLPAEASIKVPVTSPAETVAKLAAGIRVLAKNPDLRQRMSRASWEYAASQSWPNRVHQMLKWYAEVVRTNRR